MNVVLFHKGKLPEYITTTLYQIKKYNPDIDLYFISDNDSSLNKQCKFINLNDLQSEYISYFDKSDFYSNESNPLWRTSTERFFYIHELVGKLNLIDVFHFDNDVLVYDSFETILNKITNEQNLITPANENNLVCGMFYTKNYESFSKIINSLYSKIKIGQFELESIYKTRNVIYNDRIVERFHLNEMSLLKIIQEETECILNFPIMPHDVNYEKFKTCFDPSSWGQHICTYDNHPPGYYSVHHYIGRYIDRGTYSIIFEGKIPFITSNDKKYKLFNLHIHSKKLKKWV